VEIAKKWLSENHNWNATIFIDERRFKFDGPDRQQSYVEILPSGEVLQPKRIKRQCGGGGIMVWGMIFPNGFLHLERHIGRMDSKKYIQLLQKVLPIIENNCNGEYILQQDNCSVHTSKATKAWMAV
jgi:hypothetical protein